MTTIVKYSLRTGRVRIIIIDDVKEDALIARFPTGLGEGVIGVTGDSLDLDSIQAQVNIETGKTPTNDRYCVLDSQSVVQSFILGDTACGDSVESPLSMVPHATANVGWRRMRDDTWQRSLREIDKDLTTLQAQRDKLDSTAFRDAEALDPKGFSTTEIDARIATLDSQITGFDSERTDRTARR